MKTKGGYICDQDGYTGHTGDRNPFKNKMTNTKAGWVVQWWYQGGWVDTRLSADTEASGKNLLDHRKTACPTYEFRLIERTTTTTTTERVIE